MTFKDISDHYLNTVNPDDRQKKVILFDKGRLLVSAGPGAGKTSTIINRIIYLLLAHQNLKTENIMVMTFSRKAANELIMRLSLRISQLKRQYTDVEWNRIDLNPSEMYIGTIHKQCFRLWDEYEHHLSESEHVKAEKEAEEQSVGADSAGDSDKGRVFKKIEIKTLELLKNQDVINDLKTKVKYIIIDECQDNSKQQWDFIDALSNISDNICVVGDYNQSIYRFRGAVLTRFKQFEKNAKTISLNINYRSEPQIVKFCNDYSESTYSSGLNSTKLSAQKKAELSDNAVVRLTVRYPEEKFAENFAQDIAALIPVWKEKNIISDLSDIAILTFSPKALIHSILALEKAGVNVYAPRARLLMERDEIKQLVGCMFSWLGYDENSSCLDEYISDCLGKVKGLESYLCLMDYIRKDNKKRGGFKKGSEILYELLEYEPFFSYVNPPTFHVSTDDRKTEDLLTTKNIAAFFSAYCEAEKRLNTPSDVIADLLGSRIKEYEETEYVGIPNHVSALSVHQVKGLEFPVVIVDYGSFNYEKDDLENEAKGDMQRLFYTACSRPKHLLILTDMHGIRNCKRPHKNNVARKFVENTKNGVNTYNCQGYLKILEKMDPLPATVHNNRAENSPLRAYSFTGDYAVYDRCPRLYLYTKLFGFPNTGGDQVAYGQIAHRVAEKINRARKNMADSLTKDEIDNAVSAAENDNAVQDTDKLKIIRQKLLKYQSYVRSEEKSNSVPLLIEKHLSEIRESEKASYVLSGKLDLAEQEDGSLILYDIKSSARKENLEAHYFQQLTVYARLANICENKPINKIVLQYLDIHNSNSAIQEESRTITEEDIENQVEKVDKTIALINGVVEGTDDTPMESCAYNRDKDHSLCVDLRCPLIHFCRAKQAKETEGVTKK